MIASKCECGAVTVSDNGFSNSMTAKTFAEEYPGMELEDNVFGSCDHCVNHWGIDLCGCGSGEPVGKCDGGFEECRAGMAAQEKGKQRPFVGFVL